MYAGGRDKASQIRGVVSKTMIGRTSSTLAAHIPSIWELATDDNTQ